MAYITLVNTDGNTEQTTALNNYITSEMAAGNTDGILLSSSRTGVTYPDGNTILLNQRSWASSASANAFINFVNTTFGSGVIYAQAVTSY